MFLPTAFRPLLSRTPRQHTLPLLILFSVIAIPAFFSPAPPAAADPGHATARREAPPERNTSVSNVRDYLLGLTSNPADLDLNGDGVVDAADLLAAAEASSSVILSPEGIHFGATSLGIPVVQAVTIFNVSDGPITVNLVQITEDTKSSFSRSGPASYNLPFGGSAIFNVTFNPSQAGTSGAWLNIAANDGSGEDRIPLVGIGTSVSYRINARGAPYTDTEGFLWDRDDAYKTGGSASDTSPNPIANTVEDTLYQTHRYGNMTYNFPVTNGSYQIELLFAETNGPTQVVGARTFNVLVEGAAAFTNLDVFAEAGANTALIKPWDTTVNDGSLTVQFVSVVENAFICAFRISAIGGSGGSLGVSPGVISWGHIDPGTSGETQMISLQNTGSTPAVIDTVSFATSNGGGQDFTLSIDGKSFNGISAATITYPLFMTIPVGQTRMAQLDFAPAFDGQNEFDLIFTGNFGQRQIEVSGTGGESTGHPYLHVVIDHDPVLIDFDNSGSETATIFGGASHTHEAGKALANFTWKEGEVTLANGPTAYDLTRAFTVGEHTLSLTIRDNNAPPEELTASSTFNVVGAGEIPGVLTLYYHEAVGQPELLLDAVPANAEWGSIYETPLVENEGGTLNETPFGNDVMVRMQFEINVTSAANHEFFATGGFDRRLFVNGAPASAPVALPPGAHPIEARFAVNDLSEVPLRVRMSVNGGPAADIPAAMITHDETDLVPVINTAPTVGNESGGNAAVLTGVGFFPASNLQVHWGSTTLSGASVIVTPFRIELITPAGTGLATVNVTTPNGTSNSHIFSYSSTGPVPIDFTKSTLDGSSLNATCAVIGPDGRLYVGTRGGKIRAYTFDDNYGVTATTDYNALTGVYNEEILGITFNPFDSPSPVKLYVAHNDLYANGGSCFSGQSNYSGQVSRITIPLSGTTATVTPLITGLPVSNHDHAINGLEFNNEGDLLICSGSNTNMGVKYCSSGGLDESPLTCAMLIAETSKGAAFNGQIQYLNAALQVDMNQSNGGSVTVKPGVDVRVFAPGIRNPFDLVYTTRGQIYVTDNGSNQTYGPASTGPVSDSGGDGSNHSDELNLIEEGNYYGMANRNRGRFDSRQNIYRGPDGASIPGVFTQNLVKIPSSSNGIDEYRANTFGGGLRGELIYQKWVDLSNGPTYRVKLSADGRSVVSNQNLGDDIDTLSIAMGPGGVILGTDYKAPTGGHTYALKPNDSAVNGLTVYDIFPWRAPVNSGQHKFIIGGVNFGTNPAAVTVKFGGLNGIPATITSVTNTRIKGTIPNAVGQAPEFLVDIAVTVNGVTKLLTEGFQWLFPAGTSPVNDFWIEDQPNMPTALGEVATGVIDNIMYVVGEGTSQSNSDKTLAYNLLTNQWLPTANYAERPHGGNHHASEVIGGKWYLFGGLGDNSEGKVQIYDPGTNSWSLGANIPFSSGSGSSAEIDGLVYYAGGIVNNSFTTNDFARYNRVNNTWTTLPDMPAGRNHAACETDGTKVYVFGGRGPGSGDTNIVANGFNHVFIFNPATNSWSTAPTTLPIGRGGMGTAVYHNGEFFIMGGETETGPGAVSGNVYNRVDIYNPVSNSWRLGTPMPTPRHGIHPVLYQNKIYVAGGGKNKGFAVASDFDIYVP